MKELFLLGNGTVKRTIRFKHVMFAIDVWIGYKCLFLAFYWYLIACIDFIVTLKQVTDPVTDKINTQYLIANISFYVFARIFHFFF